MWASVGSQRVGEELVSGSDVASFRDIYVDDLAMLVHGAVHVAPDTIDLDVGLVHEPSVTHGVATGFCRVNERWGEALYPPINGDVIDFDASFGEEFFDVSAGQAVAEVPAHGQQDHLGREPVPGEANGLSSTGMIHQDTLTARHPVRQRNVPATLGEEVFDVSVGQLLAEVPTHSQHDRLRREAVAGERGTIHRWRLTPATTHSDTLAGERADPATQQCPHAS